MIVDSNRGLWEKNVKELGGIKRRHEAIEKNWVKLDKILQGEGKKYKDEGMVFHQLTIPNHNKDLMAQK